MTFTLGLEEATWDILRHTKGSINISLMDKREEEWEGGREESSRLCPYLPQISASLLEFLNEMKCKTNALKN